MYEKDEIVVVYKVYFPESGKCYIGQTSDLDRRMRQHLQGKFKSAVYYALQKYDDWEILVLHTCNSRDEASKLEVGEISCCNSMPPNGYNLAPGGEGMNYWLGKTFSDEHRKKIGDCLRGRKRPEHSKKMLGHKRHGWIVSAEGRKNMAEARKGNQNAKGLKHTDETKKRISDANMGNKSGCGNKGKPKSEEQKAKQSKTMTGKHWTVSDEGKKNMSEARKGNQNAQGHRWKLSDETKKKMSESARSPVTQYRRVKNKLDRLIAKLEQEGIDTDSLPDLIV
ncbi:hypothetical protein LCGC14_0425770 [marine sediment metagenome]|uniref:GIY-YIG domain-containing protein n=1 Tax=marine sediment metagenome TaxID=412755 RepID=A0A0F9SPM2_9ZZZZ